MLYNQTKTNAGTVMPLLMGCTKPQPILIAEQVESQIYDPITQTGIFDMRVVGTYSLKVRTTHIKKGTAIIGQTDRKNEIDDQKYVK